MITNSSVSNEWIDCKLSVSCAINVAIVALRVKPSLADSIVAAISCSSTSVCWPGANSPCNSARSAPLADVKAAVASEGARGDV